MCCGRSHSLGNRPSRSFVGEQFFWGSIRRDETVREGGLQCSQNTKLSRPHRELQSWMAYRVAFMYQPGWLLHRMEWPLAVARHVPGWELSCELSAAGTLSSWQNEGFSPEVGGSGWHFSVHYIFQHGTQGLCAETGHFNKTYK